MISIGFSRVPLKRSPRVIIKDLEGHCTIGVQAQHWTEDLKTERS